MIVKVRFEQTPETEYRIDYIPETDSFQETKNKYLLHMKGFRGYYGWIMNTGTPPEKHLDMLFISDETYSVGDVIEAKIIGYYKRNDNDHKILGISPSSDINDFSELTEKEKDSLKGIYGDKYEGEAWLGRKTAETVYLNYNSK